MDSLGFLVLAGLVLLFLAVRAALGDGPCPESITQAPARSFLAYRKDGKVEYMDGIDDEDAEECAADRLCPAGGYVRVEHKFENGSITEYTVDWYRESCW